MSAEDGRLRTYGTGVGIPLGAGIGGTAALLAGYGPSFVIAAGFGVAGGLVVGAAAGGYADRALGREGWAMRVAAYALLGSVVVGALWGFAWAWSMGVAGSAGALGGGLAGVAFGVLLAWTLVALGRSTERPARTAE